MPSYFRYQNAVDSQRSKCAANQSGAADGGIYAQENGICTVLNITHWETSSKSCNACHIRTACELCRNKAVWHSKRSGS